MMEGNMSLNLVHPRTDTEPDLRLDAPNRPTLRVRTSRPPDAPEQTGESQEIRIPAPPVIEKSRETAIGAPQTLEDSQELRIALPPATEKKSAPLPLIEDLLKEPVERVAEGLEKREATFKEKKAKLLRIIDKILDALPFLDPEGVKKLEALRANPDGMSLHKGFSEHSLSTYLVEAAGDEATERQKAIEFYQQVHDLAYEVISLENAIIPTYKKALEKIRNGTAHLKEAPKWTAPPPRLDPSEGTRDSRITGTIPPAVDLAA